MGGVNIRMIRVCEWGEGNVTDDDPNPSEIECCILQLGTDKGDNSKT